MIPEPKTEAGNYKTRTLFKELQAYGDNEDPVFSLDMFENRLEDGLLSFHKIYVDLCSEDPTEILLIDRVFNKDKRHWEAVKALTGFQHYYQDMVEEAKQRALAKQFKRLEQLTQSPKDNIAIQATKALFDYAKGLDSNKKKSKKKQAEESYESMMSNDRTKTVEDALKRIQ